MRRVALVCEPPDGGVAEHVAELAFGLRARGYEATVFAPRSFAPAHRLAAAAVDVRMLPLRRDYTHPVDDAASLAALVRAVARGRYDVVHGHAAKAGVFARLAAAARRVPSVYTPHCFAFVGDISAARRRFAAAAERRLAALTDSLVCVCEAEERIALTHGIAPRGTIDVIPNGCPACGDGETEPALADLRARGPVVAAVASLRRQKRLDVLVEAAPLIQAAVPTAQVAIVGNGPEEARLRDQAARDGANVVFVPFMPPSSRALRAIDLYVLPSGWEALPIGLLEAQACGVPQVVTDVGGNHEAVTAETGIVVAPGDARALAAAVVALLRDPVRREAMAKASRARHAAAFTVDRMLDATAGVYEAVSRRRPVERRK